MCNYVCPLQLLLKFDHHSSYIYTFHHLVGVFHRGTDLGKAARGGAWELAEQSR